MDFLTYGSGGKIVQADVELLALESIPGELAVTPSMRVGDISGRGNELNLVKGSNVELLASGPIS